MIHLWLRTHRRSIEQGHYTAYCRCGTANQWLFFNDQRVSTVSSDEVGCGQAYLVFYQRRV